MPNESTSAVMLLVQSVFEFIMSAVSHILLAAFVAYIILSYSDEENALNIQWQTYILFGTVVFAVSFVATIARRRWT